MKNVRYLKSYLYCFFALTVIFFSTAALGATINVPGDYQTIQEAINASSYSDDTVLVADGTYTGTGNKDLDFYGKAITVQSENGPENCIIDCEGSGRGFYFHSNEGEDSVVSGFTITNGSNSPGGGIYCGSDSYPTITNCTVSGNSADDDGGGIYCYYSSFPTITDCTISGNSASGDGGGIYFEASYAAIINCTVSGNSASRGGGIYCSSFDPIITNCTITENTASKYGGGIYCYYSSPIITNCIFWKNTPVEIQASGGEDPVVTYSDIQGGYPGDGNINADPLFVSDSDYHLTESSPCINAGTNDATELPDTDKDGNPRIVNGVVDMGAYEYGSHPPELPAPDIKANDSDDPITISSYDTLIVTVSLDPNDMN